MSKLSLVCTTLLSCCAVLSSHTSYAKLRWIKDTSELVQSIGCGSNSRSTHCDISLNALIDSSKTRYATNIVGIGPNIRLSNIGQSIGIQATGYTDNKYVTGGFNTFVNYHNYNNDFKDEFSVGMGLGFSSLYIGYEYYLESGGRVNFGIGKMF